LDILLDKKFIVNESYSDKRFKKISLTQNGFKVLDAVTPLWLDAEQNVHTYIKINNLKIF